MSDIILEMDHVYKKFRKGELYDSLRDLIPALTGKMFRYKKNQKLHEKEFWALNDISFSVSRGEAFGIIGSNGAGKSTILKHLSGIMQPTEGTLRVEGRLSALIEVGAGFHPDLTGRENVYLNGTILGMTKDEIKRKFDAIVDFSGLEDFIDTPVKRYSSGMYARLGFSVAAYVEPDILVVDEVLSVGDFMFQEKCTERMKSVINGGATVIFVSHNLRAVAQLCSRSMLLDHGRMTAIGETNSVIQKYMDTASKERVIPENQTCNIKSVVLKNKNSEAVAFETGDKATLEVIIKAKRRTEKATVVLQIRDDNQYMVFATSAERLGQGNVTLEAGEELQVTFEIDMNMALGTFHLAVTAFRYDTETYLDYLYPAATFYVSNDTGANGVVHCKPKVISHQVVKK